MKVPPEHEAEIRRILSGMKCPRGVECCDPTIEKSSRVHCLGDADLIECLDGRGRYCPFGLPFGYAIFCRCPVRKYLVEHDLG
jgi:hypothetical protein